jgi:hypothetical protein
MIIQQNPVIMACGTTICSMHVHQKIEDTTLEGTTFQCPACQMPHQVDDFPINRIVEELLCMDAHKMDLSVLPMRNEAMSMCRHLRNAIETFDAMREKCLKCLNNDTIDVSGCDTIDEEHGRLGIVEKRLDLIQIDEEGCGTIDEERWQLGFVEQHLDSLQIDEDYWRDVCDKLREHVLSVDGHVQKMYNIFLNDTTIT